MTDEADFRAMTEPLRRELELHCYRMLGSVQDAEDLVQETFLAAWRGVRRLRGPRALRTWLYKIATNRCLNALRDSSRRPFELPQDPPEPTRMGEPLWLQPLPDEHYETREAVGLAFVTGLQHLPPTQRAALVLRDVLGYPRGRGRGDARHERGGGQQRPAAGADDARVPRAKARARAGAPLTA